VAFATNTLYGLEINKDRFNSKYESILFPIIREKSAYLHIGGISSSIYAISKLNEPDLPTLKSILKVAKDRDYNLKYGETVAYSID